MYIAPHFALNGSPFLNEGIPNPSVTCDPKCTDEGYSYIGEITSISNFDFEFDTFVSISKHKPLRATVATIA